MNTEPAYPSGKLCFCIVRLNRVGERMVLRFKPRAGLFKQSIQANRTAHVWMYSRLRCEYHGFYMCCLCQHTKTLLKNINLSLRYYIVLSSLLLLLYYSELKEKICAIGAFLYMFSSSFFFFLLCR